MSEKLKSFLDTFNSLLPAVRIFLAVGGAIIVFMLVNDIFKGKDKIDDLVKQSKEYEKQVTRINILNDSLQKEVAKRLAQAAAAETKVAILEGKVASTNASVQKKKGEVDSLKAHLADSTKTLRDSVDILVTIVPKQDSIIVQKDSIITDRTKQVALLRFAGLQKDSSIVSLKFANDTLVKTLKLCPTIKTNPNKLLGFIPMPSRKTATVIGFVLGVYTTARITR